MAKTREHSEELKKKVIDAYQSGEGYKKISKRFFLPRTTVMSIIHKWKESGTTSVLPRSGRPRKISTRAVKKIVRQVSIEPKLNLKDIQTDLKNAGTDVHLSTIRTTMNNNGLHGRVAVKKPYLSKKHQKSRLDFAKKYLEKPFDYWSNIIWSDETKIELFGHNQQRYIWRKKNTAHVVKNTVPTVKHGGGSIMIWGCFNLKGTGKMTTIEGRMDSVKYQSILKENLVSSANQLGLGRRFIFQQDNDPKHTSKSTKEWFTKQKVQVLEWPSQSPDLNPIEHLWHDLKIAVHKRKPSNLNELQQYCKEEWTKIPVERCRSLIEGYR